MGSVSSSINPALADLFQTLANVNSPALTSPAVTQALEKASPGDIVQLSMAANQLESVDAMFGVTDGSTNTSDNSMNNLLASLDASLTQSLAPASGTPQATTSSASSTASATLTPAEQVANNQSAMLAAETAALFGNGSTSGLSDSLFDVLA